MEVDDVDVATAGAADDWDNDEEDENGIIAVPAFPGVKSVDNDDTGAGEDESRDESTDDVGDNVVDIIAAEVDDVAAEDDMDDDETEWFIGVVVGGINDRWLVYSFVSASSSLSETTI